LFYGEVFVISLVGTMPRFENEPFVSALLLAEAAIGVLFSAWLTYLELAVIHAICIWCVASAVIVLMIFLVNVADLRGMRRAGIDDAEAGSP
jgi:uncharacterized membrane protein